MIIKNTPQTALSTHYLPNQQFTIINLKNTILLTLKNVQHNTDRNNVNKLHVPPIL